MKQFILTPAAGKRLIAKAAVIHPAVRAALASGTLVIVAGTTNGYVAEEVLASIGQAEGFDRKRFFRGITLPPDRPVTETGRLPDESEFPGDVVIVAGRWLKGRTIFDAVDGLKEGDVIMKGANAVDLAGGRAAVLIGHPKAGTLGVAIQAAAGRRVRLIFPVGVEKRIEGDLDDLVRVMNEPGAKGPRLLPGPGEILTEIEAVALLTGADAQIVAGGGVCGAEGSVWLAVRGTEEQERAAGEVLTGLSGEPAFQLT